MYGTIARMRLKPGSEAELERLIREHMTVIGGIVFQHAYRTDTDPNELYLAVGFDSKEAYRRNAESPEQHARYEKYRQLLTEDPQWHDGEIIFSVSR